MTEQAISPAPLSAAAGDNLARRNALVFALATALAGANTTVLFATAAIVGAGLAPSKSLATLPVTIFVVGLAAASLPVGMLVQRFGRRTAYQIASGAGVAAGLLAAIAVLQANFALFCLAAFFSGFYASSSMSYRFAAADTATPAFRPKAISWVLVGGVLAGVIGPQLVIWTQNLMAPVLFAATYLAQAGVALIAGLVLSFVDIPKPAPQAARDRRPLGTYFGDRRFVVAVACGAATYMLMNFVMTAAPLAMIGCNHTVTDAALGIQWHVIAMYAPSFFTGHLIARFGAQRVVACGLALTALSAAVALTGITVMHFYVALILLGIGWNFGYVGATTMVADLAPADERARVQSINDFCVFGVMACGSFLSGHILTNHGWDMVNWVVFPVVIVAGLALAFNRQRRGLEPA